MTFDPAVPEHQPQFPGIELREGFHGTSLYVLARVARRGLQDGFAQVSNNEIVFKGIFNHSIERVGLCRTYMLYTALDDTGYYWSPLLTLRYPVPDPKNRRVTVPRSRRSCTQWLTHEDVCEVTGVWLHRIHFTDMLTGPKDDFCYMEGRFLPHLELDPKEDSATIDERSKAMKDHIWW